METTIIQYKESHLEEIRSILTEYMTFIANELMKPPWEFNVDVEHEIDFTMNNLDQFEKISSIRDEQEKCYYADFSIQVLRSRCIDNIEDGMLPIKWMGVRSYGLITDGYFDIDAEWQLPVIENWLIQKRFDDKNNT